MKKRDLSRLDQLNIIVFPMVYGQGSQDNEIAKELFELMIKYAQNSSECILKKEKDRNAIINQLTKASPDSQPNFRSLAIKFLCEYGSAIKLTKEKEHSPINIQVITLEQWATGANDWKAKKLELVNPAGQSSLFAPTLSMHSSNLSTFELSYEQSLRRSFQIIKDRKNEEKESYQYSSQEIEEACKLAIDLAGYSSVYASAERAQKQGKQEKKNAETIGQRISLNNGSPDTAWYVVKAVALNLIGTEKEQRQLAQKFIIGFRGYLLKQATAKKSKDHDYQREEVEKYKLCLDELINQYKMKISQYSKKIQRFNDLIYAIEKNLIEIKGGKLTSRIQNRSNFYKELDVQVKERPLFVSHQDAIHQPQPIEEKEINDFPINIEGKFVFQQLNDLYQTFLQQDQSRTNKWLILTQKVMWRFAQYLDNDNEVIDLNIHMRQIECEVDESTMGQVLMNYQAVLEDYHSYYGMQLPGQVVSHIQLMRAIAAAVSFEAVNQNRARKKSNLFQYRVPIDFNDLFNKFHSNCNDARRAMRLMKNYYNHRSLKKQIFELNATSTSFHEFGRIVGSETRSAKVWKETIDRLVESQKLVQVNRAMGMNLESKMNTLRSYASSYQQISNTQITNVLNWQPAVNIQSPCQYYPTNDPWLYAFLNNIPPDILGMIKMLHFAQNPTEAKPLNEDQNLMFTNKIFKDEEFPIKISAKKLSATQSISISNPTTANITTINPQAHAFLYSDNSLECQKYEEILFYQELDNFFAEGRQNVEQMNRNIQLFLNPPSDQIMTRQHEAYARLHQKPEEMELQNYESMCNVRSAQHTQLLLLCSGILQRKITSDSYDVKPLFAERLILQTGAKISAYHKETQRYFGKIQKLIREFKNVWVYSDTSFCPILAPILSVLAQQIIEDQLAQGSIAQEMIQVHFQLSKKCLQQFKRAQKQLFEKPGEKIQWDQRFVCVAAICCFRQVQIKQHEVQQIVFLLEMIFRWRTSKILSDREQKPKNKRLFQLQLDYSVQRAIFRNIGVISNYIYSNTDKLSDLVKSLDNSFPSDITWTRINLFHFKGASASTTDIYQLDIDTGSIYKNGKQLTSLDDDIKSKKYYKEIFGEDRQFQVFPSHNPYYVRTKDNVNYQFKINEKRGSVYFEFSEDGETIRHVIKKNTIKCEQQIWSLIPRQKLKKVKCHIPKIYSDNHLAWYSSERKCIVFRKPRFEEMYEIGMVIFLDDAKIPKILSASHITYHGSFENQNLDEICDPENKLYQELVLRKNDKQLDEVIPFKVLSKFQDPTFILELRSRKTNEVFYLLHRYLLKFKIVDNCRLLSETYFGYALDYSYILTANCLFNMFPCLVLEKYLDSPTIMNNHKRILLISDGEVAENGVIHKQKDPLLHLKSYKYDIHDFFEDIRGMNREAILQLAVIILSINDNIKIEFIEMTPLQYAMHLLKACFSNRPLLKVQVQKLSNIMNLGSTQIVLLSEALWKMSTFLSKILPFAAPQAHNPFWQYKNKFLQCRTLYQNNYNSNNIKFRQAINKDILNFLGIKLHESNKAQLQQAAQSSDQFQYERHFWSGIAVFTGMPVLSQLSNVKDKYQQFQEKTKILNIWNEKAMKQRQTHFPSEIDDLRKKHSKDEMMNEMISELTESFQVYCKEEARITQISNKITTQQKESQQKLIKGLKEQAASILKDIEAVLISIKRQNESHPDVITGIRPTISPAMYTSILCEPNAILEYFPALDKNVAKQLKEILKVWLELKTRMASFERIEYLLGQEKVDVVAVMREVLSPREVVFQKNEWLCFEAEMKVQLWPSQLETYNNLMSGDSGSFCQLNMGEGKTQVIIPLIILNTIYANPGGQRACLPRINLLSSLFEEARGNFFRFISATGFQIPAFQIPFNRKVKLVNNDISAIKHLIDSFSNKAYILMTRESRLSQILRFQQGKIISKMIEDNPSVKHTFSLKDASFKFDFKKEDTDKPLIQNDIFDVFDEIDALMYCKKSYIFSIGDQLDLEKDMMRFEIVKLCLEVFLTKYFEKCLKEKSVVTDQTDQEAIQMAKKGEYPIGLRLTLEEGQNKEKIALRRNIARTIVFELNRHEFSFIHLFNEDKRKEELLDYLIEPEKDNKNIPVNIPDASKPQIYLLRGILAYGIFEHCLSMRCGVDFGAPNASHLKKIAVPYEAADIPSKTSEYEQPDISALLSYIAYYTKGLTRDHFEDCLKALLDLSKTSKEVEYNQWIVIMEEKARESFELKTVEMINYNSKAHRDLLFQVFKKNRKTVAFWLIKCVFLKDLKQYARSICSSAWDLAAVPKSVGFSGTKDNRWLYSNKLKWRPSKTPEIHGTDGKMLHLITKFTNEVTLIEQNNKTLWQRFVDLALEKKVGCIIDAGALCVGKSLRDEIVPWIAAHQKFDSGRFCGISFCDSSGRWFVYDIEGKFYIPRGTTIPDNQTFVVFDQARTRGADLKMDADVVAALSLGPELTKDSLMQAAGRLRKLGRNQSLVIMATHEVFSRFEGFPQQASTHKQLIADLQTTDKERLPKMIIAWCCENSVKENHDLLMQFADLGWKHLYSQQHKNKEALQQELTTNLEVMYSKPLLFATVSQLGQKIRLTKDSSLVNSETGNYICNLLDKYGKTVIKQAGTLDDVCEREVEAEKEKEKEQEDGLSAMKAVPEVEAPKILTTIPEHPFYFDPKFKMTTNFIETTNSLSQQTRKELPQLYFVKIKFDEIVAISIREASRFIETNIIKKGNDSYQIFMLNSLQLESKIINLNGLERALVSAKFLSGIENYPLEEENHLLSLLFNSVRLKKEWKEDYNLIVSLFLRLKRVYLKKFQGSTLEKLITRLHNGA